VAETEIGAHEQRRADPDAGAPTCSPEASRTACAAMIFCAIV
jgi:hypothetical protein